MCDKHQVHAGYPDKSKYALSAPTPKNTTPLTISQIHNGLCAAGQPLANLDCMRHAKLWLAPRHLAEPCAPSHGATGGQSGNTSE